MTDQTRERSHDVLHYDANPLNNIFAPKSVAVIGATEREGSVGRTIMQNLMQNDFGGVIYPVNLKRKQIFGSFFRKSVFGTILVLESVFRANLS